MSNNDREILVTKLYAEYWMTVANTGAYKLPTVIRSIKESQFDHKLHRRMLSSRIVDSGYVTHVELTDEGKLKEVIEIIERHLSKIGRLIEEAK